MKEAQIDFFLYTLKDASILEGCSKGDIEKRISELVCVGCGDGKNCQKNTDIRPCYKSDCEACGSKQPENCSAFCPCDDCFDCGCPKCELPYDMYDGYDEYPPFEYESRRKELEKKVVKVIAVEKFLPFLSENFIRRNFPWQGNQEIWRQYLLHPSAKTKWEGTDEEYNQLSESDKAFFLVPDSRRDSACNYNFLRILSGQSELNYSI
jgi:hypothetical protein